MTDTELNEVRHLKRRINDAEQRLMLLRSAVSKTTPHLDGLPHARPPTSNVEYLLAQIIDIERDIKSLREELELAAARLACRLYRMPLTTREYSVIVLRYVACMTFRDIQFELHMSDATVFYHHRNATKKILKPTVESQ